MALGDFLHRCRNVLPALGKRASRTWMGSRGLVPRAISARVCAVVRGWRRPYFLFLLLPLRPSRRQRHGTSLGPARLSRQSGPATSADTLLVLPRGSVKSHPVSLSPSLSVSPTTTTEPLLAGALGSASQRALRDPRREPLLLIFSDRRAVLLFSSLPPHHHPLDSLYSCHPSYRCPPCPRNLRRSLPLPTCSRAVSPVSRRP